MPWRSIRHAPRDGTAVLVRCGQPPQGYHLVSYVDGAWMDVRSSYILSEEETGLPTHYTPLPPDPEHTRHGLLRILSDRSACAVIVLAAAAFSMLLGTVIENHFDLWPN